MSSLEAPPILPSSTPPFPHLHEIWSQLESWEETEAAFSLEDRPAPVEEKDPMSPAAPHHSLLEEEVRKYLWRRQVQALMAHLEQSSLASVSSPAKAASVLQTYEQRCRELQEHLALPSASSSSLSETDLRRRRQELARQRQQLLMAWQSLEDPTDPLPKEEEVEEEELARQVQNYQQALQEKKALLARLQQEAAMDADDATEEEDISALQQANSDLSAQQEQLEEIRTFYQRLCQVLEALGRVRLLSMERPSDASSQPDTLVVRFQVDQRHEVHMQVQLVDNGTVMMKDGPRQMMKVQSAEVQLSSSSESNLRTENLPVHDLVQLAPTLALPHDQMRFVLQQIMFRINAMEARVQELQLLQQEVLTQIGPWKSNDREPFLQQQVICSCNEQITLVLLLTPECPLVAGSVRIQEWVALGGWDPQVLQPWQAAVQGTAWKSPLGLMRSLKQALDQYQALGQIPRTPRLPQRRVEE